MVKQSTPFGHMDNPIRPDNLARCTARKIFATYEPGGVPAVFLPPAATDDAEGL